MSLEHLWAGWRHEYIVRATEEARAEAGAKSDPGLGSGSGSGGSDSGASGSESDLGGPARCVFCRIEASGEPSPENGVVWRSELSTVVLNAYPYASGHVLVMPRRHLGELAELTDDESNDLWRSSRIAVEAVSTGYTPDGLNLGANLGRAAGAGIPRHLHLHVVPRWLGDTNFMTAVADTRVLPETLDSTWHRLRDAWPS